jgi:hypothetical protein
MFRMAVEFAGIFTFDGIDTNSIGLAVNALLPLSSPAELLLGPQITAECLENVKSISKS